MGEVILDYKRKNNNDRLPVLTSSFQGIEYQEKHFGSQQKHDTSDYNVLPKEYMTYRNRSDNGYFRFNINNLGVTGIVSKFYPVFTTINTNKLFLASYINHNHRLKNHFKVVSVGTSQHVLSLRNFKKTNLLFPSKDEQDQIGKFFNLLNRAITLQQRKLEQLKQLKKAMLQQLFVDKNNKQPTLRFKNFKGDWKQHRLGEISTKVTTKNQSNASLPVFTNSAKDGIVNQEKFFDKQIANNTSNYYVVNNNDFVYNPRISKNAPFGPIRRNTLNKTGIMSPLYYIFSLSHNTDENFLSFYFLSSKWYKFMYENGDSGARSDRFAIKDKVFQQMPIKLPLIIEQTEIGKFLNYVNILISLQQTKLTQLTTLKKYLLQKMFI